MDEYIFDLELNESSPISTQPDAIITKLKLHQLACLYKANIIEKYGVVNYNITKKNEEVVPVQIYRRNPKQILEGKYKLKTNIGIIGDIVGYGKTLTALSIIAANNLNDIHINKEKEKYYNNNENYSYFGYTCENNNIIYDDNNIISSTLVIVPRGPVFVQWEKTIKNNTTLKYLAIDNLNFIKKHLPSLNSQRDNIKEIIEFFNKYDVVLIKNTTLDVLFNYYFINYSNLEVNNHIPFIKKWKRIMIDEAHDIINKIPLLYYNQLWLISATYQAISYDIIRTSSSLLFNLREIFLPNNINLMLIKCSQPFVKKSFKIPIPDEQFYLCKLSLQIDIIKNFISKNVLDKINANDLSGAIKDIGCKNDTQINIIEIVSREINREILNKEKEYQYVSNLDIHLESKNIRLKNIETELIKQKNKLNDLKNRINELSNKMCAICMDNIECPIMLKCTHAYCCKCLFSYLNTNKNNPICPECRTNISLNDITAIVDKNDIIDNNNIIGNKPDLFSGKLNKEETLLEIIKNKPNGKFLIFSKYDNNFINIIKLLESNNITSSELKGSTNHMMNILNEFKIGNIKIILLNSQYAGSGIDISFATDVIIFHSLGLNKQQAIGRAQRVGRTEKLFIHNLCYQHEM